MPTYELYAVRILVCERKHALDFYSRALGMPVRMADENVLTSFGRS